MLEWNKTLIEIWDTWDPKLQTSRDFWKIRARHSCHRQSTGWLHNSSEVIEHPIVAEDAAHPNAAADAAIRVDADAAIRVHADASICAEPPATEVASTSPLAAAPPGLAQSRSESVGDGLRHGSRHLWNVPDGGYWPGGGYWWPGPWPGFVHTPGVYARIRDRECLEPTLEPTPTLVPWPMFSLSLLPPGPWWWFG